MTANDVLKLVTQTVVDLLNPDTWRILLLLLVVWGVVLLLQIRRLLTRLVEGGSARPPVPRREEPLSLDDLISRH